MFTHTIRWAQNGPYLFGKHIHWNSAIHFWYLTHSNHLWLEDSTDCLANLYDHHPDNTFLSPDLVCNWPVAARGFQLPNGNRYPLLRKYAFPKTSGLMMMDWWNLLTQLHEGLFLHLEVLKPLVIIPSFKNDVIPQHRLAVLDEKLWSTLRHTVLILTVTTYVPWDHSGLSLTLLVICLKSSGLIPLSI